MKFVRTLNLFFFLFLAAVSAVHAEDVNVSSSFDRHSVHIGEEVHLTIRVSGTQGNIQAPRLPSVKNFDTYYTGRASHLTFINGQSSSSVEFSYTLVPRQEGRYTVGPIDVMVNNQRYTAGAAEIEVAGSAAQPSRPSPAAQQNWAPAAPAPQSGQDSQEPPPTYQPDDDNIFVKAWVDKTSVYPNEQVLLTYSLYTRYDTRYEGFDEEPQVSGFWIEEFPMEREIRRETVRVNGKRYVKADVRKMALFPTAAADYTIQPGTMKASIRQEAQQNSIFDEFFDDSFFSGGSFFARRENRILKPPPIQIKVKPYPEEGKPASFNGATGNFRMSAALDKTSVKQNDPVTMKLVIEGEGNIETLNKPPVPDLPQFKTYDADSSSQLFKTGNVIGGRKTFEIVFIPLEAGVKKIPSLEFSYFNPIQARYVTLKTNEFAVNVAPSADNFKLPAGLTQQESLKKEVKTEDQDIRFIQERLPESKSRRAFDLLFRALVFGDVLMTFLVAFGLMRERQEKIYAKDISLKRRSVARARAEGRMRKLKMNKDDHMFFEETEKIMTQYLSDKFNISAHGTTRYDLEALVDQALGAEDPLSKEIRDFYSYCEEARFARGALSPEMKAKALKTLRDTIVKMERVRLKR